VNKYGRPPLQVAHGGGAYISQTLPHNSAEKKKLLEINRRLIKAMKMETGATHAEFIKSEADSEFYFLEIAARVGGAYIADVLEAASGINLWREWAKLEVSGSKARLRLKPRRDHAGIILSLARQESPDTSAYDDPEIVYRTKKKHHVGLIVRSKSHERVTELLHYYGRRFDDDFIAVLPPLERPEESRYAALGRAPVTPLYQQAGGMRTADFARSNQTKPLPQASNTRLPSFLIPGSRIGTPDMPEASRNFLECFALRRVLVALMN